MVHSFSLLLGTGFLSVFFFLRKPPVVCSLSGCEHLSLFCLPPTFFFDNGRCPLFPLRPLSFVSFQPWFEVLLPVCEPATTAVSFLPPACSSFCCWIALHILSRFFTGYTVVCMLQCMRQPIAHFRPQKIHSMSLAQIDICTVDELMPHHQHLLCFPGDGLEPWAG